MIVNEIFLSIDGEVNKYGQGSLTTFVRFAGCNLRCLYCDTVYSQKEEDGKNLLTKDVFLKIINLGCNKVTLTGGDPLYQDEKELNELFKLLVKNNFKISVETNGTLKIPDKWLHEPSISWVVDYKLPSSGHHSMMNDKNFIYLSPKSWIKFVISDKDEVDYESAIIIKNRLRDKGCRANFAISPILDYGNPEYLINKLIKNKEFDMNVNIQLHKLIGIK